MKIYKEDRKYSGEEYDVLSVKLQIFFDLCTKVGIEEDCFHLAFSTMLRGKAADFYYDKIAGRSYDFFKIIEIIFSYFETEESR